jgi:hypothetical protein
MMKEQFDHEIRYQASILPFRRMLESKIISDKEYAVIDTILRRKYAPVFVRYIVPDRVDTIAKQR